MKCPVKHHGVSKASGCGHVAVTTFSRLFDDSVPNLTLTEEEAAIIGGPGGLMHDFDGATEDSPIPTGYIFFAQFIDHDVTLDTTSGLRDAPKNAEEVSELPNIRSASLDLDCVYGFGPEASPHIYDAERPGRLAVNPNGFDLARAPGGSALIGDPRNDENIFVAQIQLLFHRFHNRIYNERIESGERFEEAQKETRYHYQWLVLFDFLKRLCDRDIYKCAVPKILNKKTKFPLLFEPDEIGRLTMPVEFSVAAYRVGHTLVRSEYAVNADNLDVELFDERFGTLGFSGYPEDLVVDWRYLLDVDECIRPRLSKAVDEKLANELQSLPLPVVDSNNPNDRALAFRNLLRGNALGLPSGQDAAKALKAKGYPIDVTNLKLDEIEGWKRLDRIADGDVSPLRANTPLFYYVLRESQVLHEGERFGPVGSAILLEVFGGMLRNCESFINTEKEWNPDPCISKEKRFTKRWETEYQERFNRKALIERDDYFPFELADVVRFVEGD